MKPVLGWTMLSWEEMRQVERALASGEQDTRDEIGFLLIHQGFADRFFPGTSVLHTRVRYALFVPWLYLRAAHNRLRGVDLDTMIRRLLIELAIRLKQVGGEPYGVIGGDKLGQLTSQPPDRVYWTALRTWGLLLPGVDIRSEALRRLTTVSRSPALDDDGGSLLDEATEVFSGLPHRPAGWDNADAALNFRMPRNERAFLRRKLGQLTRPDNAPSLLAQLVEGGDTFDGTSSALPDALDARADGADKVASVLRAMPPHWQRSGGRSMARSLNNCWPTTEAPTIASFAHNWRRISINTARRRASAISTRWKRCCPDSQRM
jgi:hypothetical protein